MKDIEELRGLAVIEGKDLANYEYELLKDLYEENQEQQKVLYKLKEYIENDILDICEEAGIGQMVYDKLNELLEEIE